MRAHLLKDADHQPEEFLAFLRGDADRKKQKLLEGAASARAWSYRCEMPL
jgi:hypothetical protein